MCGICGIVGSYNPENLSVVKQMNSSLALRGPDNNGLWHRGKVFLGHTRLSIIDVESGHQPMVIERGEQVHVVTLNGEIYNYKRLQKEIMQFGIEFSTNSDTEVLLQTIVNQDTISALNTLEGMFAFGWWDECRQRLVLARDRMGIKPLYYHHAPGGAITFGSSLESVILNPNIELKIDLEALGYYFTIGYPPAPLTMYAGIYELPPAHFLVWESA